MSTGSLRSVDNALRLLHLLRDQGRVGVSEAAAALGISTSACHRLLANLAHRGFAVQDESRAYHPGPALRLPPGGYPLIPLRDAVLPEMGRYVDRIGETLSLGVVVGTSWRIVATAEANRRLRVGDLEGMVLPAWLTAGGRAALSQFDDEDVVRRFTGPGASRMSASEMRRLLHDLRTVRERGGAVNHGEAEEGVSAVAAPLVSLGPATPAALAVVLPSSRFTPARAEELLTDLGEILDDTGPALDRIARLERGAMPA